MAPLIKGVLNYSRLSKSEITFENTDLQNIIDLVKLDMELVIEEKKANIKASNLPVVSGISQQLHQLFYNLINNSLKFTDKKPFIFITAKELSVNEIKDYNNLQPDSKYVQVILKDNGIGFDQKHAKQIFTIFKRLNSNASFEGTGIGLALCKKIVDNHHGIIEAESEIGLGTSFKIILPVK